MNSIENITESSSDQLGALIEAAKAKYQEIMGDFDSGDEVMDSRVNELCDLHNELIDLRLDRLEDERLRAQHLVWAVETGADGLDDDALLRLLPALAGRAA